ncbi:hypothetical protein Pint_05415 [Pistacia integerrima]|uniref:Uncharacterized protein n=1 Tax=Pistacia integerrima TaxID=434235 RepID=A0ACC0Z7R4_9ROSI|nr:hypothetical protein Pint_05415 [Pistacia integerrima]
MNSQLNVLEEGSVNRNQGPRGQGGARDAEQFFEFQGTALDDQVRLAAYHLEKDAQLWYQHRKNQEHLVTWESMKVAATEDEDFFGDLCKFKQTSSVSDYQAQFERLLARAGTLKDKQEVECFISGLKEGIRADVRVQNP